MRILIVEPGRCPRTADIPHTLEAMQEVVGGYIQAIYPWEDQVALVCDDEGLLKQYRFNRMVGKDNAIFGTFFLCGLSEEDFTDLLDELLSKYEQMFHMPEVLVRTPGGYVAFTVPTDEEGGGEQMNIPDHATVERVRAEYPPGTRAELIFMDDSQAPPVGTIGEVLAVDDAASLIVIWKNGSGLNVIFGIDRVRKIDMK